VSRRESEVAQTLVCSQQQGLRITVCAAPVGNRFITTQQNYGIALPLQLVLSSDEACVKLDTNSSPPAEDFGPDTAFLGIEPREDVCSK
jgi:hypothetical protein